MKPYGLSFITGHEKPMGAFATHSEALEFANSVRNHYSYALIYDGGEPITLLFGTKVVK